MKNRVIHILTLLLLLGNWACYEDRGNYSYKDINRFTVTLEPEIQNEQGIYWVTKPLADTSYQLFTAHVDQSLITDTSDLHFTWYIQIGDDYADTAYLNHYYFEFPKGENRSYEARLIVEDGGTGLKYYDDFSVKTRSPYYYSWAVVHGQENARALGMIEFSEDSKYQEVSRIVPDAWNSLYGTERFRKANNVAFMAGIRGNDRLLVFTADSVLPLNPYSLETTWLQQKIWQYVGLGNKVNFTTVRAESGEYQYPRVSLIGEDSRYYTSTLLGTLLKYSPRQNDDKGDGKQGKASASGIPEDYVISAAFPLTGSSNYDLLWDGQNHRFYYCQPVVFNSLEESWLDVYNLYLDAFSQNAFRDKFKAGDLEDRELVWMGKGMKEIDKTYPEVATVVMKYDNQYDLVHIGFQGDKGSGSSIYEVKVEENVPLQANETSRFATSASFDDQLFYTNGTGVYCYINSSADGQYRMLHDVGSGNTIVGMKFRLADDKHDRLVEYGFDRILAVAVNTPDGKGEIHELFLNTAGDVDKTEIYTGFGEIVDFDYMPRKATISE